MDIQVQQKEQVTIITLIGNLLGEDNSEAILKIVTDTIENKNPNFIFEVKEMKYINSTGLSILINTLTKARKAGGEMCLVNTTTQLQSLLKITKLDTILLTCGSIEEAITKLNS